MTSSTGDPVPEETRDTVAWIVVAVILLGVITAAVGLMAVQIAVIIAGAGVVAVGLILAVVLPRFGISRPVSFAENVPTRTDGPRGTDDDNPAQPTDTDTDTDPERPRSPDLSPYQTYEEVPASELPSTPDTGRAKPQHVNLAPDERIRRIDGEDVIEVPDEQPPERRAEA
jgi:hypothetical protein